MADPFKLFNAFKVNDPDACLAILREGDIDLDAVDEHLQTPLHLAVIQGMTEVCAALLGAGFDPNAVNGRNRTPLHLAAQHDRVDCLALLIARGGAPDRADLSGWSPLHLAAKGGKLGAMRILIDARVPLDEGCETSAWQASVFPFQVGDYIPMESAPLHLACVKGSVQAVEMLVAAGASLDRKCLIVKRHWDGTAGISGKSALFLAIDNQHVDLVKRLIELGAPVNSERQGFEKATVLHVAARRGEEELVRLLCERGVALEARDAEGKTALHRAAENGYGSICKFLIECGAAADALDISGKAPHDLAAWEPKLSAFLEQRRLVQSGKGNNDGGQEVLAL